MSRTIRLGIAAGLALAAFAQAWAADGSAAGNVWYDEFYSSAPAGAPPAPAPRAAGTSRRASHTVAVAKAAQARKHDLAQDHARRQQAGRLARSR